MTDCRDPERSPQKASFEIRQELLDALGLPPGAATVARRPTSEGDTLVVRMTAPNLPPAERRPDSYQGFPVAYEIVEPLKIERS
jgi:hypothetical protein